MPAAVQRGDGPPDGGWGWVVLVGAFISIAFSYGFPKAIAVFFNDIQQHFHTTSSDVAWISSITLAVMYAGGPLSSILVNRFGSRPVVMLGGVLTGTGMFIASFSNSIVQLYICIGVIGGLGLALNLQPALTIVGKYFLKRRPMAIGLAMAGSPVGLSALAPFNQFLLINFGYQGSFMILGAICFHCTVAGALMRPIGPPPAHALSEKGIPETQTSTQCQRFWRKFSQLFDLTLFRHRGFIIYLIGCMTMFFGLYGPIVFLTPYAISEGYDEYKSTYLLSMLAFVDMFFRPGSGMVVNLPRIRPKIQYVFAIAVFLNGVCDVLCPLARSYMGLVVYSLVYGAVFGTMGALLFEVLMDLVGPQRFASAVGLVTMAECCPVLLGPPFGGWLVDVTGQYRSMYIICGIILMFAGAILLIGQLLNNWCLARKSPNECPPGIQLDESARKIEEDTTLTDDHGASTA
uniref:monocarboxylate transporter 2-like n=1 Tax=Myxine glutinosa TaxID=7769 RepID=UPI0035902FDB